MKADVCIAVVLNLMLAVDVENIGFDNFWRYEWVVFGLLRARASFETDIFQCCGGNRLKERIHNHQGIYTSSLKTHQPLPGKRFLRLTFVRRALTVFQMRPMQVSGILGHEPVSKSELLKLALAVYCGSNEGTNILRTLSK
jgi:hypothetical protein